MLASAALFSPVTAAPSYTYKTISFTYDFGQHYYDYYYSGKSSWVMIFFPGGLGYRDRIEGCLGYFNNTVCNTVPRGDEWLAKILVTNSIDFIEAQKYTFSNNAKGVWLIDLIRYIKTEYKYTNIILAGFSGGGGLSASAAAQWPDEISSMVNYVVIYEGPTNIYDSGPMGSSHYASQSKTKTFMAYGINDEKVPVYDGMRYFQALRNNIPKLFVTEQVDHNPSIIVSTLDSLYEFIGKPKPPTYIVETSTIMFTTTQEVTNTILETTTALITTTQTNTATTTSTSTSTSTIKVEVPDWDSLTRGTVVIIWFMAFLVTIYFVRKNWGNDKGNKGRNGR